MTAATWAPPQVIDGRAIAAALKADVATEARFLAGHSTAAGIATLLIGGDYAARAYERRIGKMAAELGVTWQQRRLPEDTPQHEVMAEITVLNADPSVSGILVLRPVPPHISEEEIFTALDPAKDIEAVHPENAGLLALGRPRYVPSTPAAVFHVLDQWLDTAGEDRAEFYHRSLITVVGRSSNVGKPAVSLAYDRQASVDSVDEWASRSGRLGLYTRRDRPGDRRAGHPQHGDRGQEHHPLRPTPTSRQAGSQPVMTTGSAAPRTEYVLAASCADRPGIIHAVTGFLVEHDANVTESQQFADRKAGKFFTRIQFQPAGDRPLDAAVLREEFTAVAGTFCLTWKLTAAVHRQRTLIMVSKFGHCLNDLLFRASTGALHVDVAGVVSNHPDLAAMADNYRIPFFHVPVEPGRKSDAEAELLRLVGDLRIDLVILARYMQILSGDLCKQLEGRAINIHHSMLPSFKGARPYFQAYERGVKLVGATAHYVTADLDEGPIIEQTVARVDHAMTPEAVTALGRDTECLALARAVQWHSENRVLLEGKRTVVFR